MIKQLKINQYDLIENKILEKLNLIIVNNPLTKSNIIYSNNINKMSISEFLYSYHLDISIVKGLMLYRINFIDNKYIVFKIPYANELNITNYKQELRQILLDTSRIFLRNFRNLLEDIYHIFNKNYAILNNSMLIRYINYKFKQTHSFFVRRTSIHPIINIKENEITLDTLDINYVLKTGFAPKVKMKNITQELETVDVLELVRIEEELEKLFQEECSLIIDENVDDDMDDSIENDIEDVNNSLLDGESKLILSRKKIIEKLYYKQLNKIKKLNLIDLFDYYTHISDRFLSETNIEVIFIQNNKIETNYVIYQIGFSNLCNKILVNLTSDTTTVEVDTELAIINLYDLFVTSEERKQFFIDFLKILNSFELDNQIGVPSYIDIVNKKFNPNGLQESLLHDLMQFYNEFTEYESKIHLLPLLNLNQALNLINEDSEYFYINIFDSYEEDGNSIVIIEYQSDFSSNKEPTQLKYINGEYRKEEI